MKICSVPILQKLYIIYYYVGIIHIKNYYGAHIVTHRFVPNNDNCNRKPRVLKKSYVFYKSYPVVVAMRKRDGIGSVVTQASVLALLTLTFKRSRRDFFYTFYHCVQRYTIPNLRVLCYISPLNFLK